VKAAEPKKEKEATTTDVNGTVAAKAAPCVPCKKDLSPPAAAPAIAPTNKTAVTPLKTVEPTKNVDKEPTPTKVDKEVVKKESTPVKVEDEQKTKEVDEKDVTPSTDEEDSTTTTTITDPASDSDHHENETPVASEDKSTIKAFPPIETSNLKIKKISDDVNILLA
jgi:hypothetical protein